MRDVMLIGLGVFGAASGLIVGGLCGAWIGMELGGSVEAAGFWGFKALGLTYGAIVGPLGFMLVEEVTR